MTGLPLIAIVDDDHSLRNSLDNLIRSVGFRAQGFSSAGSVIEFESTARYGVPDSRCATARHERARVATSDSCGQLANPDDLHYLTRRLRCASRALESGAVDYLYKPFREEELLNAIDAALKHS